MSALFYVKGHMADKQKLRNAIKQKDGWWATIFSGRIANIFLSFVADIEWLSPNMVTTFSLFVCIIACVYILNGGTKNLITAAFLIQLSFIFDCLDGQIARYRNKGSNFGAWYDRVTDRVKDFLIYFSIALGYFSLSLDWKIWPLAMTSLFFVYLFDYYVNQDIKLEPKGENSGTRAAKKSSPLNILFSFGEKIYKFIPILQFHIGEQYLLISLFLIFNKPVMLFKLIIYLGVFYSFYWPLSKYYGRKPG